MALSRRLDRSFADLGSEGYSHQKSQNATYSPPPPGPNLRRYKLIWPTEGTRDESDLFDGIEVRFDHLFDRLSPGERGLLKTDQARLEEAAKQKILTLERDTKSGTYIITSIEEGRAA